jgi:hypothetical protein
LAQNEYRLYITIPDLAVSDQERWQPLIAQLEERHGDLGPIIGWADGNAEVVVSMEADSEAHAVQHAVEAVAESLHRVGLGDHYPAAVEVETQPEPVPA